MLSVEKMWEGIREEGIGSGLPMVHLKLGPGQDYTYPEDLVREVMTSSRCKWICVSGRETTQIGMGTAVKGFHAVGLGVEIEVSGSVKDPGWLNGVDRWIVDYVPVPTFNLAAMRSQDCIRFTIRDSSSLTILDKGLSDLAVFPGTKYVKILGSGPEQSKLYNQEVLRIARKYDRTRVYRG